MIVNALRLPGTSRVRYEKRRLSHVSVRPRGELDAHEQCEVFLD
jgi:hypothetical protein